jgi:hypothetical protein
MIRTPAIVSTQAAVLFQPGEERIGNERIVVREQRVPFALVDFVEARMEAGGISASVHCARN